MRAIENLPRLIIILRVLVNVKRLNNWRDLLILHTKNLHLGKEYFKKISFVAMGIDVSNAWRYVF